MEEAPGERLAGSWSRSLHGFSCWGASAEAGGAAAWWPGSARCGRAVARRVCLLSPGSLSPMVAPSEADSRSAKPRAQGLHL